jgi:hypothetical protein
MRIKGTYGSRHRRSDDRIIRRLIVEGSMRFDMLEDTPSGASHSGECSNLSQNRSFDLVGTERKRSSPESLQVRIAGMSADRYPRPASQLYRTSHHQRISGMNPASDIDRRHQRYQRVVVPHVPGAE